MVRRRKVSIALTLFVLGGVGIASASCAGQTTSTPVETTSGQCILTGNVCVADADCCSLWCVSGHCQRRQP
jgi:hypothetical protein